MTAIYWHISQGMVEGLVAIRQWNLSSDPTLDRPVIPRETQRSLLKRGLIDSAGHVTSYGQLVLRFLQQADDFEGPAADDTDGPPADLDNGLTEEARALKADMDAIEQR